MIGKALSFVLGNWQAALAVVALLGATHTYVYFDGRGDGKRIEAAKRDAAIARAVLQAVEAEREAAAKHEARETQRQATTNELREAAANAPAGEKVKAVLDALRNS